MVYWSTGHWFHRGSLVAGYWRPGYIPVTRLLDTWLLVVGFAPGYWLPAERLTGRLAGRQTGPLWRPGYVLVNITV